MTKISNQYSLTNVLFADAVNGRVGIGTESPLFANSRSGLSIRGNANGAELLIQSTTATNGTSDGFVISAVASDAYLFNRLNGFVALATNNLERMRITATGNVGIGTTSPVGKFNIVDGTNKSLIFQDSGVADTFEVAAYSASGGTRNLQLNAATLIFGTGNTGGSSSTERMRITSGGLVGIGTNNPGSNLEVAAAQYPFILITGTNSTQVQAQYGVNQVLQAAYLGTNTNHTLVIHTNGTERMRITSGGFIKISNTGTYANATSNYHEIVTSLGDQNPVWIQNRSTSTPYGPYISFPLLAPNNLTQYFLACGDSATSLRFVMYSNGSLYNSTGVYAQLSDIKLKENIVDATPKLDDLLKVKIRNYNLIGDGLKQIGVIAQELEEIFPNMIDNTVDKDTGETTKGVKYSIFIPMLIKGLQEQQTQINELKALLNA